MARDRAGSDYSGHMSDTTTCSCVASSIDKCSLRGCGMFQEPFFLHPPGSRPRDGIYINPMSAYIGEPPKPKDTAESFYLHSPHDLVYTRITRLFGDAEKPRNGVAAEQRHTPERKDETLTVKVDVHINNGGFVGRPHPGNGHAARSEIARESSDHAYEQICVRQEETSSVSSASRKKPVDNTSDSSRSRKTDRRYSRSSSASESSNMSSEVHGLSSTTSTPSLSRHSSSERIGKPGTKTNAEALHERKDSSSAQVESEKEIRANGNGGPSLSKPPPPPPPPPPDDDVVVVLVNAKPNADADKKDARGSGQTESFAANKSDASSSGEHPQQPEVPAPASAPVDADEIKASQASHLVNRHMVLPFIPPKFANADSNTLLKPSEYLKSICKVSSKNSLSKARSVDNLDIQSRNTEQGEEEEADEEEGARRSNEEAKGSPTGPPPPPLSPLQQRARGGGQAPGAAGAGNETESSKSSPQQPLATISIQDLTSIQLRRTGTKMNATKTFSAPPPRSVSMTNVSEPFFVQKTDLIAELKRTKDIPGIKKLKVERAQVEKTQEQNLMSEISKAFNVTNFVDQIPEKDSSGNVIPIWKRQMLARKAAERAKKELEEQIARENEERRQKAIPPWKRQLLAKKDTEEKRLNQTQVSASATASTSKFEVTSANPKMDASPAAAAAAAASCVIKKEDKPEIDEKRDDPAKDDSDDGQIIPWRAQLRKTNSKLNILD
ncbi:PREDICTED: espin [Wasmannia auropunctata]|uniref:espin n=1 Tax=Wasmannia auropunctata TaxID=64793 RepID=UPI0005ED5761|nr:PREDICTED: espin [Wasmannia auropunctata]